MISSVWVSFGLRLRNITNVDMAADHIISNTVLMRCFITIMINQVNKDIYAFNIL